jgi:hypothetical protein
MVGYSVSDANYVWQFGFWYSKANGMWTSVSTRYLGPRGAMLPDGERLSRNDA